MRGLLTKTLVVEEGYSALLLVEGRHDATLGPGKHSIGNVLTSKARDNSVVLFRNSDVSLDMSVDRLLTSDPLVVALDYRLVLKIDEPLHLWSNLARRADSYNAQHLAGALYLLAEEACEIFVKSRSVRELGSGQDIGQELQLAVASHLEQPLARWGMGVVSIDGVSLRCQAWDAITQARTEYFLAASDEQVVLEGRKRLFDVYQQSDLQTMAEETAVVAGVEKRASLWERLRQALLSDARGKLQSQQELEDLLRQADKDRLLKTADHEALVRTMTEAKEDREKARIFVLRRVEAEHKHELDKLDLAQRFGLSQERLALEMSKAR